MDEEVRGREDLRPLVILGKEEMGERMLFGSCRSRSGNVEGGNLGCVWG